MNKKVLPRVLIREDTLKIIEELEDKASEFQDVVRYAVRPKRCCCFGGFCRSYNKMFGTIEQNQLLLERNFDGKHFWVRGHNGAKLDCMFFPCTIDD